MEDEYFDNYILENMPFHISQIFVSVSSASQMDDAMKTIDESTAKKLAEISTRLINGEKNFTMLLLLFLMMKKANKMAETWV